jgi:tetratricopeptide (TPR) repeat protein
VKGKREIVDGMVRRYLLHTRIDESEKMKLYGLPLLRRADQPAAVAAALGLTPEQAQTTYEQELSRLHRRYSFVFTEKDQPALHQEVRHFLRLWLLERRKEPEIVAVNQRLHSAHAAALKALETSRQYATLQDRLEDDEWVGVYLDLAEQQCWLDPVEGVRALLPFMLAAAIYRRESTEDVVAVGQFFATDLHSPYRAQWQWATESLVYTTSRNPSDEELKGLTELAKLARERCPTFPPPLPDARKELEAALWWRLGEAYLGIDDTQALAWYEQALGRLGTQHALKEAAAEAAWNIAKKLYEEKKHTESLTFLNRAIELNPNSVHAFNSRGVAYRNLKQYQQAIADYNRAIALDANYAFVYYNRGNSYSGLKQYEQAIADYDRAIELDPNDANAHYSRGYAYLWLHNTQQAHADYRRSYELDPTDINAAWMAEWAAMGKQRPGIQTAARLEQIAEIDPSDYISFVCRGVALGLHGQLKAGLAALEQAIPLDPEEWDAYFWKGMLAACYHRGGSQDSLTMAAIEHSLQVGLPPVLLTPLYWLEPDRPTFFAAHLKPLLAAHEM